MGCSSDSGTSSTQAPVKVSKGSIALTARTKPVSTSLTPGTATPDGVAITIDEAAISTDGSSYETIMTGPIMTDIDSQMHPDIAVKDNLVPAVYKSVKLTVSKVDWHADWTLSNPSPCDGATSGSASGSLDLSATPTLYFNTADMGGNTLLHYQSTPPESGYAGDADHPFILPAPIHVESDETAMVSLVLNTEYTLGCSRLSVFPRTAGSPDPDVSPLREIVGTATGLFGVSGVSADTDQKQVIATNGVGDSLTIYPFDGQNDVAPVRSIAGPDTRLNDPVASAFYSAGQAGGSGNQYIVLNHNNDSIVTYSASDTGNVKPLRTIWGLFTGLSNPTGFALNLDPLGNGDPAQDEILVANGGNDSITSYARIGDGDTFPLRTLQGSLTELAHPCAIAVYKQHHEVFVGNSNSNIITVYDLFDLDGSRNIFDPDTGAVLSSPHINIPPLLTVTSSAGFSEPCGITVDGTNAEIIVAGKGNDSISVFDLAAVPTPEALGLNPATAPLALAPKRTIAGPNTGLHGPSGAQVVDADLWVSNNGGQTVMMQAPSIIPAVSNESAAANSTLDGTYNIVRFGIDFRRGTNGFGSKIPVIHAERGTATFSAQAANWPSFTYRRDSAVKQFKRQVLEPGCDQPDHNIHDGFFGVATGNTFYAFTQENQGMFSGSFLPNGEDFAGVSYDGAEMAVIYGIKTTGTAVPYLSKDGSNTGSPVYYVYANYSNYFKGISRFLDPPKSDQFYSVLNFGYLYTNPSAFLSRLSGADAVFAKDPMGEFLIPKVSKSGLSGYPNVTGSSLAVHAGGLFENAGYGMAGAISEDSKSMIFVDDIATVDENDCQVAGGIGVGLRQGDPNTFKTKDIKGDYFFTGIGDDFQSSTERARYFSMSGTISFDGGGKATMVQYKNSEGEISATTNTFAYQVVSTQIPGISGPGIHVVNINPDVLRLYNMDDANTPYAKALIGVDGRILTFFQTGTTRLLGTALQQNQ